jgi:O-antigen/teichoic acid export membrane protein
MNLRKALTSNWVLVLNAGSLVATTVVTSGLGFVYWWAAARLFSPAAVGLSSAAISAMMLIGTFGMLGLGTLLMGELPRQKGRVSSVIISALFASAVVSGGLGATWGVVAPHLFTQMAPLGGGYIAVGIYALGVALAGVTMVMDQALIGLFRGSLQLWRNTVFAVVKLVALVALGVVAGSYGSGLAIYVTWIVGNLVSMTVVLALSVARGDRVTLSRPDFRFLRCVRRAALQHHALNLALQSPSLALPVMAAVLVSAEMNASFYIAWMIASFVFTIPNALTSVLYAIGAAEPSALARRIRFTLGMSLTLGLAVGGGLMVGANEVLGFFGSTYVAQGGESLRVLVLVVLPMIVKYHYVAIARVLGRIAGATKLVIIGCVGELSMAAAGATLGGLTGLSLGWLLGTCIEAGFMFHAVYVEATRQDALTDVRLGDFRLGESDG